MSRSDNRAIAMGLAAEATRLQDLRRVPPPPGARPLDLPGYDERLDPWVQPEFMAWQQSSAESRNDGTWRDHPSLLGTDYSRSSRDAKAYRELMDAPSGRTTNADAIAARTWGAYSTASSPSELAEAIPPVPSGVYGDGLGGMDLGRWITRPSSEGGDEGQVERMPYAETALGADALQAPEATAMGELEGWLPLLGLIALVAFGAFVASKRAR